MFSHGQNKKKKKKKNKKNTQKKKTKPSHKTPPIQRAIASGEGNAGGGQKGYQMARRGGVPSIRWQQYCQKKAGLSRQNKNTEKPSRSVNI